MIDSPNSNVQLTLEQLTQIETTKSKLSNLENEIKLANKNLLVVNKDVLKATKEKEYQEELIIKLSKNVLEVEKELESLENSKVTLISYLDDTNVDIDKRLKEIVIKEKEIKEREEKIVDIEKYISEEKEKNILKEKELLQLEDNLNFKISKLKEIVSIL